MLASIDYEVRTMKFLRAVTILMMMTMFVMMIVIRMVKMKKVTKFVFLLLIFDAC